jgi:SpoVK/Ycf46/Vps4 family AAA+-type ATPase
MRQRRPDSPELPIVPWSEFWPMFKSEYRHGRDHADHVTIIGPTGTGKSTIAMQVAELRRYVVALVVKPRDEGMRSMLRRQRFVKLDRVPPPGTRTRVVIWPKNDGVDSIPAMRTTMRDALDATFRAGVWHVVCDEASYLCEDLKLNSYVRQALRMGRSNGMGLILCAQRPAWLPHDIYSSATHLFLFGSNDAADLRTIAGLNGVNDTIVRDAVANLGKTHRFVYVNTRSGYVCISRYER